MTRIAAFRIANELDALFKRNPLPKKNAKTMAAFQSRLDELTCIDYCLKAEELLEWARMFYSDSMWTKLGARQVTSAMTCSLAALRRGIAKAPARCFKDNAN